MGRALGAAGALALAGCGGGAVKDSPPPPPKPTAMPHPDARFLVDYGGQPFRVNVRYVPLIDESVIAIRKGVGEAAAEDWQRLVLPALESYSPELNFADDGYEDHIVLIGGAVQDAGGICPHGMNIAMQTGRDGQTRTLYRSNRQVWVVFALCPEPGGGAKDAEEETAS